MRKNVFNARLVTRSHPWLQAQRKHLRLAVTGATTLGAVVAMTGIASIATAGSASAGTPAVATTARIALPSSSKNPQYGVLLADPTRATTDHAAGVRLEIMQVSWASWEPKRGTFSSSYEAQELARVNQFRKLGDTVGINLSLNLAPAWALALSKSQLIDQNGHASGTLDYEFSSAVRTLTATYVKSAVKKLGKVSYYTLGASNTSEALYPSTTTNQWWAFGAIAQGQTSGMASGVGRNPMPGWVPGTSTWKNHTVTDAQVQSWYNWYIGALANFIGWEKTVITKAGYNGYFELGWPGTGTNPWVYNYRLTTHLAATPDDSYDTMNSGSVYQVLLNDLPNLNGMVVDVSSVGDGSGTPADNACEASDASVNYRTDSAVDSWSSIRWLSYLAARHGLPIIGESTGGNSSAQMAADLKLVRPCGLIGLQWAFDYELYSGGYATIANYKTQISDAKATR